MELITLPPKKSALQTSVRFELAAKPNMRRQCCDAAWRAVLICAGVH